MAGGRIEYAAPYPAFEAERLSFHIGAGTRWITTDAYASVGIGKGQTLKQTQPAEGQRRPRGAERCTLHIGWGEGDEDQRGAYVDAAEGTLSTLLLAINMMSSSHQPEASSSSAPNFRPIFEKALEEYKKKTGKNLTAHPLAAEIRCCDSPEAILTVLEGKAKELNQSRSSDERLTKWLNPTVNILNVLSATLGEGAGSVFPPTKIIFSGIGVLLVAAKSTVANHDLLVKLFSRIESFFQRLKIYTNIPSSPAVMDELSKIMAEVLTILGIATKGIKEGRTKIFLKKVAGMNDLEDAIQRFSELEQRELLTGVAQVTSDTSVLKDDANETKAMVKEIAEKMN
ncbi:hypothetical protein H4582DRAFT_2128991, partial [Lactarius indigo]